MSNRPPGPTFKNPAPLPPKVKCSREIDGEKCGAPAYRTMVFNIEIMGTMVNVKKPVCDPCWDATKIVRPND